MRLRQWRRWPRTLALVAFGALMLASARARADGSAEPPGENERVVKIGPQAVVIVNERGDVRMYDDPSEQVRGCESTAGCLGKALGTIAAGFTILTFEGVAQPSR